MRNKVVLWSMVVVVVVLGCLAVYFFGPEQLREPSDITFEDETSGMTFEDEPEARALYEKMIETMRKAESHLITLSTGREKWSSPNIRR